MKETALFKSVRLTIELHRLHLLDRDQDAEGDLVRDEMDLCWYSMTETEQNLVRKLSAALYVASDITIVSEEPGRVIVEITYGCGHKNRLTYGNREAALRERRDRCWPCHNDDEIERAR